MVRVDTPQSSFLEWFTYDRNGKELQVRLRYGHTVTHRDVPQEIFNLMNTTNAKGQSVGRFYLNRVRGKFNVTGASERSDAVTGREAAE